MRAKEHSRDWSLLSAYIDGEMTAREKEKLEQHLRVNPGLRNELEQMRTTRAMLRSLPRRKVPHNFVLTPEMVKSPRKSIWLPLFGYTSAASAMIALVLLLVQFLPGGLLGRGATQAEEAPAAVALYAEEAAKAHQEPVIIYWGGPPPLNLADGKGGGGGESPPSSISESPPVLFSSPAGGEAPEMVSPEKGAPEEQPAAPVVENEAVPMATAAEPPQEALSTEMEQPQDQADSFATQDEITGPILGIRPEEEGGQMTVREDTVQDSEISAQRRADQQTAPPMLTYIFVGLSAAAGIAAFIFWRRLR